MKLRCIIIDDEPLARLSIKKHVEKVGCFELVGEFDNPIDAFGVIKSYHIDVIFLDIDMGEMNGIEFLNAVRIDSKVIIITAHPEFAMEGFELDITDYLLKPVTFERFLKAINKVYLSPNPFYSLKSEPEKSTNKTQDDFIYVREKNKSVKICIEDINYIEGLKEYIQIVTAQKKVTTMQRMGGILKLLPQNNFLQIHKSFIISLDKVSAFTSSTAEICGREIPIGRKYKKEVINILYGLQKH